MKAFHGASRMPCSTSRVSPTSRWRSCGSHTISTWTSEIPSMSSRAFLTPHEMLSCIGHPGVVSQAEVNDVAADFRVNDLAQGVKNDFLVLFCVCHKPLRCTEGLVSGFN